MTTVLTNTDSNVLQLMTSVMKCLFQICLNVQIQEGIGLRLYEKFVSCPGCNKSSTCCLETCGRFSWLIFSGFPYVSLGIFHDPTLNMSSSFILFLTVFQCDPEMYKIINKFKLMEKSLSIGQNNFPHSRTSLFKFIKQCWNILVFLTIQLVINQLII